MPFTQYVVTVQAYTKEGAGPPSPSVIKGTLEGGIFTVYIFFD